MLNSDELGGKGEAKFEELCYDARLIPNKSTRDRTGWDYIVEWPTLNDGLVSRDRQPAALATLVQVKSVWESSQNVRLRLSSIERLVKDPRPSFVVILRFSRALKLVDLNVVHVRSNFSASVLKRLRNAHKNSQSANDIHFSFGISKWSVPIHPSGNAFRELVESVTGDGLPGYGQSKTNELNALGFDGSGLSNTVTFRVQSEEELIDGLLGLRSLDGSISNAIETRFGIALPLSGLPNADGVITFQPEPSCKCDIIFRESISSKPLIFESDMFVPPRVVNTEGLFKAVLKADLFSLVVRADSSKVGITFKIDNTALNADRFSVPVLRDFHQLIFGMSKGEIELELRPDNGAPPITGSIIANPSENIANYAKHFLKLCDIATEALSIAGVREIKLSLAELDHVGDELLVLGEWLENPNALTPLSFVTEYREGVVEGADFETLYFAILPLGDITLAYCGRANMVAQLLGERVSWNATEMEFVSIRLIDRTQQAMDRFIGRLKEQTGVNSHIAANISE